MPLAAWRLTSWLASYLLVMLVEQAIGGSALEKMRTKPRYFLISQPINARLVVWVIARCTNERLLAKTSYVKHSLGPG